MHRPSLTFPFLVLLTPLRLDCRVAALLTPVLVLASNTPAVPIVLQLHLRPRVGLAPAVPLGSTSRVLFIRVVAGPAARAAANAGSAPSRGPGPPQLHPSPVLLDCGRGLGRGNRVPSHARRDSQQKTARACCEDMIPTYVPYHGQEGYPVLL